MAQKKTRPGSKTFGEIVKFGLVGGGGFLVDFAVFNALLLTFLKGSPLTASIIATVMAMIFNWIGNRYWTFHEKKQNSAMREFVMFCVASLGGLVIAMACVWFSHYVLGFTSLFADNIAKNVVGLALGTAFRFAAYKWWVFSDDEPSTVETPSAEALADNSLTSKK